MKKNINIFMEGGLGDLLLSSRFAPAIREIHGKNCEITAYYKTDGATFQRDAIKYLYPSFFDKHVILEKSDMKSEIFLRSNECFNAVDNFPQHFDNLKDDVKSRVLDCDHFYNLHIDSMDWVQAPEFRARFSYFPAPEIERKDCGRPFVAFQPFSRPNGKNFTHEFYLRRVVSHIVSLGLDVKIIVRDDCIPLIPKDILSDKVEIFNKSIEEVCDLILDKSCKLLHCLDSGFKSIAVSVGTPLICHSVYSPAPHQVSPQQMLRWMPFEKNCFPLNWDLSYMTPIITKLVQNPEASLFPHPEFDKLANLKFKGRPV